MLLTNFLATTNLYKVWIKGTDFAANRQDSLGPYFICMFRLDTSECGQGSMITLSEYELQASNIPNKAKAFYGGYDSLNGVTTYVAVRHVSQNDVGFNPQIAILTHDPGTQGSDGATLAPFGNIYVWDYKRSLEFEFQKLGVTPNQKITFYANGFNASLGFIVCIYFVVSFLMLIYFSAVYCSKLRDKDWPFLFSSL